MKKNLLFWSVVLVSGLALAEEFATYPQRVKVTFATPAAAQAATAQALVTPPGKTLGFSARWDDSGPEHAKVPMARMLASHGMKATFYLCSGDHVDAAYVERTVKPILALGGSIGSHTVTHPMLQELLPNAAFDELMQARIDLEARCQRPVTAFVLPFCRYETPLEDGSAARLGRTLARAGYQGGPEFWPDAAARFGLSSNDWVASSLFSPGDRHPTRAKFDQGIAAGLATIAEGRDAGGPHITLGVHTWQDAAALQVLSGLVATRANRADTWYCNENEWIAARLGQLHAGIRKIGTDGATATFEVERVKPYQLGAAVPLTLRVSPAPVSAVWESGVLPVIDGAFALPHDASETLPALFVALTDAAPEDPGLPGVRIDLGVSDTAVTGAVRGVAGPFELVCRPSICWKPGPGGVAAWRLRTAGAAAVPFSFPIEAETSETYAGGVRSVAVQCDFTAAGRRVRAWRTVRLPAVIEPSVDLAVAGARFAGPFKKDAVAPERLVAMSRAGQPLVALDATPCGAWRATVRPADRARFLVAAKSGDAAWRAACNQTDQLGARQAIVVFDIDCPTGRTLRVAEIGPNEIYCLDGQRVKQSGAAVRLDPGVHRLVALLTWQGWRDTTACLAFPASR